MNIQLVSKSRYNGGINIKRQFGSSTITEFHVHINGILQDWTVKGYGPTPGDRKTYAKKIAQDKAADILS